MYETFEMKLRTVCKPCGAQLPVNGVTDRVTCAKCGRAGGVGRSLWRRVFSADDFVATLVGRKRRGGDLLMPRAKYSLRRVAPRCLGCKGGELDPAALAAAVGDGAYACPGCGASVALRAADDLCRSINPHARFMVGERVEAPAARPREAARTSTALTCSRCGGPLETDGSARVVMCTYCSARNVLSAPERGRTPQVSVRPFFMVCVYDEEALALARISNDRVAEQEAGKAGLPAAVYEALAGRSMSIRCALAGNPAAPPQVLSRLLDDSDERILTALVGNPAVPAARLPAQASATAWHRRLLAASHPEAAPELLHPLARDDDQRVRAAATRRLTELRARGVDVRDPNRRGLLGRLFGR